VDKNTPRFSDVREKRDARGLTGGRERNIYIRRQQLQTWMPARTLVYIYIYMLSKPFGGGSGGGLM